MHGNRRVLWSLALAGVILVTTSPIDAQEPAAESSEKGADAENAPRKKRRKRPQHGKSK